MEVFFTVIGYLGLFICLCIDKPLLAFLIFFGSLGIAIIIDCRDGKGALIRYYEKYGELP